MIVTDANPYAIGVGIESAMRAFEKKRSKKMDIPRDKWSEASGGYVIRDTGVVYRIIGFIDRPAVTLDPVDREDAQREVIIMGTPQSREFRRLIPEER